MTHNIRCLLTVSLICAFAPTLTNADTTRDADGRRSKLTADDVVAEMAIYRRPDNKLDVLEFWISQLGRLKDDIAISTEMTDEEKRRKTRSVERRIEYLQSAADRVKRAEAQREPDPAHLTKSPTQKNAPQQEQVPTGWRRSRSWQGGGFLPGGSWQGAEYQEVWGQTLQRGSSMQEQNGAPMSTTSANGPQIQWPQGFGQFPWTTTNSSNGQSVPNSSGGILSGTGGGIMVGGGASASSSRSAGSRILRQAGGR